MNPVKRFGCLRRIAGGARSRTLAAVLCAGLCLPAAARAYMPPVDDLWARLAAGVPAVKSAVVETETQVFDPEAAVPEGTDADRNAPPSATPDGAAGAPATPPPPPLKERGFRQRLYWQRGTLLAVETFAADGTLAHLLLQNGYRTYARTLTSNRNFSEADLRPLLYPFLEGSSGAWHDELVFWGIQPLSVDFLLSGTGTFYRLGERGGPALWLDRASDRPAKLDIRTGGMGPVRMEIRFSEYMPVALKNADADNPRVPKVMIYTVNGRPFRKSVVVDFQPEASPKNFPLSRWRQQLGIPESAPGYAFGRAEGSRS